MIPLKEARKIDAMVRGYEGANEVIWSPTTSVVNSKQIISHLANRTETENPNLKIYRGTQFLSLDQKQSLIKTSKGDFKFNYLINAAGQQSLHIAHDCGFGKDYSQFPIKGLYSISDKKLDHVYKTLVYPVPRKGAYFLGVHSTLTVDGYLKIGPTVSPAFSCENYNLLDNLHPKETMEILMNYVKLLMSD